MKKIQILGVDDYSQTLDLKKNVYQALKSLSIHVNCEEVNDIEELLNYHLTGIPAIAIDGQIIFQKSLPSIFSLALLFKLFSTEHNPSDRIQNILIPIDFSANSENAYQYGHCLAAHFQANIELLHVLPINNISEMPYYSLDEASRVQSEQSLKQFIKKIALPPSCCDESNVRISEKFTAVYGLPDKAIIEKTDSDNVDLIVMSTTGSNGLLQKMIGSTSRNVAIDAKTPVVLIPKNVTYRCPRHILYATNHHPDEMKGLKQLVKFAKQFNAYIHIVHIDTTTSPQQQVRKQLESKTFKNGIPNIRYKITTIYRNDVLEGLNDYILNNQIDMIAIATVHRPLLKQLFHKSTTRKMAIQTTLPLMVLHI
jgi:nucleotide-binding universal stress UspA family protein